MDERNTFSMETASRDAAGRAILLDDMVAAFRTRKWVIAAILLGSGALALALAIWFPFSRKADVTLYPLSDFEVVRYQDPDMEQFLKIDSNVLNTIFVDVVREGVLVRKAMIDNKIIERQENESSVSFDTRLERAMTQFSLKAPTPEAVRAGNRSWTMSFQTRRPDLGYGFLVDFVNDVNSAVRERLVARYERTESEYIRGSGNREKDLRQRRANLLADYDRTTNIKLAELTEQIALLRSSGNKDGRMLAQTDKFEPGQQISVVDTNKMVFVPGYDQLERNAELIRSRADKTNFVKGLLEVDQELRDIEQDPIALRARAAYERTLANASGFQAMTNDLTRASFLQVGTALIILLGVVGLGIALAAFVLFSAAFGISRGQRQPS